MTAFEIFAFLLVGFFIGSTTTCATALYLEARSKRRFEWEAHAAQLALDYEGTFGGSYVDAFEIVKANYPKK